MDEKKIIDAISAVGKPIWNATQRKVILEGSFAIFISIGLFACFLFGYRKKFKEEFLGASDEFIYYTLLAVCLLCSVVALYAGMERFLAIDHFVYKALLP
jgi:hypothetical protein